MHIFPLISRTKEPLQGGGFYNATSDPIAIKNYWKRWPNANIGFRTDGIIVVDVDCHKDGEDGRETLREWEREYGSLPDTWICLTPTGGAHFYFRSNNPFLTKAEGVGPGVDYRGPLGYVLLPPSIHPDTGTKYEWDAGHLPNETPLADIPEWLLDKLLKTTANENQNSPHEIPEKIPYGSRNKELFYYACSLRGKGLTAQEMLPSMLELNKRCDPPLEESEVKQICESSCRYARGKPEEKKPVEHKVFTAKPAADFGDSEVKFVWFPYIPIGDYTVLMSPGGTGKTYFTCGIAAFVSTGKSLPGDYKPPGGGENVLIISAEDRGEMLKKRLSASGADLNRVFIIDCLDSVGMNFSQGIETFKMTIQQYNPRLVIVDPWHAFLGEDVDINRVNAVRPVFQQIANVAKDCNCGMILISHVNKRAQGENANNAATGSSDFVNAARSAIYIIFDESCEDGRIAVHTKTNYAKYGRSVCFQITENGGLLWTGFSEIDRGTMEEAARHRKTPGEVIKDRDQISETRETLVRALIDAANPFEITRFTYDQFREAYGDSIFGTMQAKRILDSCAGILSSKGYILQTGIKVRDGNSKSGGFAIRRADLACTQNEDD